MTFLITIWSISILVLLGTGVAALMGVRSARAERYLSRGVPVAWWDMFVLTYQDIIRFLVDKWHDVVPHIHNGTTHVLTKTLAHRDSVYAKMFGYPAVPQGGVVSFFLKRIVVHKEEFRQKVADRRALHDEMPEVKPKHDFSHLAPGHKKQGE